MNLPRFFRTAALLAGSLCAAANARAQDSAPTHGYHLDATWKIGGEGGWDYLTVDPEARRLYVTRTDRVQVIDTETGKLVGEVPGLDGGHGTAIAPDLGRGFATSGKNNAVLVFDLKTLRPIGEPIPVGKKPDAIVYDPASKHVFAFNGESSDASVLDAASGKVLATIALGGGPEFAVADAKGSMFVNLEDKNETLAIETARNTIVSRWPLAPGEEPTGLSLDPLRQIVFAGCHNQKMIAFDAGRGLQVGSVPIGKGVDATAFDPGTGLAFASCGDGTLTVAQVVGAEGLRAVEVVKTKPGARTMALDPSTHAVYLAAADYEPAPPEVPGQPRARPKAVPGSFVILKFVR